MTPQTTKMIENCGDFISELYERGIAVDRMSPFPENGIINCLFEHNTLTGSIECYEDGGVAFRIFDHDHHYMCGKDIPPTEVTPLSIEFAVDEMLRKMEERGWAVGRKKKGQKK